MHLPVHDDLCTGIAALPFWLVRIFNFKKLAHRYNFFDPNVIASKFTARSGFQSERN